MAGEGKEFSAENNGRIKNSKDNSKKDMKQNVCN